MVRQGQIYLATATSTALLLAASVAIFVVLAATSSLRNFPIPGLSGFSSSGVTGSDKHAAPTPSDPSSPRSRNVSPPPHGGRSGARLPTDARSAASGPARAVPSSGASPVRLHDLRIGANGQASPAPVSLPSGGASSVPASAPSKQKSSASTDPVATPSGKHSSVSHPPASGKAGVGGKTDKGAVGGKSDKGSGSSVPSDGPAPSSRGHGVGHVDDAPTAAT